MKHARKPKIPARYVRIDQGYGPAEHWETIKVIDQREVGRLFDDGTDINLLVELSGGERQWVAHWNELDQKRLNELQGPLDSGLGIPPVNPVMDPDIKAYFEAL